MYYVLLREEIKYCRSSGSVGLLCWREGLFTELAGLSGLLRCTVPDLALALRTLLRQARMQVKPGHDGLPGQAGQSFFFWLRAHSFSYLKLVERRRTAFLFLLGTDLRLTGKSPAFPGIPFPSAPANVRKKVATSSGQEEGVFPVCAAPIFAFTALPKLVCRTWDFPRVYRPSDLAKAVLYLVLLLYLFANPGGWRRGGSASASVEGK
jgi:hypothetical protein